MYVPAAIGTTLALCTTTLAWDITFYENKNCGQNGGSYVGTPSLINNLTVFSKSLINSLL
jgi:hypothetical protein